jgi:UDP-N-acetylmuramoylalanine--D-glutamate ligase
MTGKKEVKILIVGLGYRSGLAAANFLAEKGKDVSVSDLKSREELADTVSKLNKNVKLILANQNPEILDLGFDLIVLSPGVPKSIPLIKEAVKRGIRVIAEIELAYENIHGKIIAITGTDGKSTTTVLTGHILDNIGIGSIVGGNLGIPLVSLVGETGDETVSVVELSSYQLETIDTFRPDVCAFLNVTPDHLDRYSDMNEYFEAKFRITMNQTADDFFIYNSDDDTLRANIKRVKSKALGFSLSDKNADAYYENGFVFLNQNSSKIKVIDSSRLNIFGLHNIQNIMASVLMVSSVLKKKGMAADFEKIGDACYSFKGLEHRVERIGEFEGRIFINDSKATTVGAVQMALKSLNKKGILILGGVTKGDDYSRLIPLMEEKVKGLVLIGESAGGFSKIYIEFKPSIAQSMDDAVIQAMKISEKGDDILLSPACASFDMFKNFEERGRAFKASFLNLKNGKISWI